MNNVFDTPLPLGELRNTGLIEEMLKYVDQYQVPIFIKENPSDSDGGSGTLIKFGNVQGILTASHVAAYLDKEPNRIYLPIRLQPGSNGVYLKEPVAYIDVVTSDDLIKMAKVLDLAVGWSNAWLDICLIKIERNEFDRILNLGSKKVLNLQEHYTKYKNDVAKYGDNENRHWIGGIYGHPRGKNKESVVRISDYYLLSDSGFYVAGPEYVNSAKIKIGRAKKASDLVKMDISIRSPRNFAGASGGGFWKILLHKKIPGEIFIEEFFFAGVFVYADTINEVDVCLKSRGPKSLYDIFCQDSLVNLSPSFD